MMARVLATIKQAQLSNMNAEQRTSTHLVVQHLRLFIIRSVVTIFWGIFLLACLLYLMIRSHISSFASVTNQIFISLCCIQGINAAFNVGLALVHLGRFWLVRITKRETQRECWNLTSCTSVVESSLLRSTEHFEIVSRTKDQNKTNKNLEINFEQSQLVTCKLSCPFGTRN